MDVWGHHVAAAGDLVVEDGLVLVPERGPSADHLENEDPEGPEVDELGVAEVYG